MPQELHERLFESPTAHFIEHLNIENNERIIFSGRFGIGKTTFLRDYFFTEKTKNGRFNRKKDYNIVHIFPVNYSIAQNEDIFRYIKYDILLEMMAQGITVENVELEFAQTIPFFIRDNAIEVGVSLLKMIPLIGKEFVDVAQGVRELIGKFRAYNDEKNENASNERVLLEFIRKLELEQGSIYEQDIISNIIEQELEKLKERDDDGKALKENILIIDDLDRVDPEHIFRILNVFAAHFDRPNKAKLGNKFGFDKIVLVCDIANIRQIFKAKFGLQVDFNGYIDKFYSQHIFEFKPYEHLYDVLMYHVEGIRISSDYRLERLRDYGHYPFMRTVLEWLVSNQEIDLRNVFKLLNAHKNMRSSYAIHHTELPSYLSQLVRQLEILCHIKGDYLSLIESIERSSGWKKKVPTDQLLQYLAGLCCIVRFPSLWDNSAKGDEKFMMHGWRLSLSRSTDNQINPFTSHAIQNGAEREEFEYGKMLKTVLIDAIYVLRKEEIL